MFDDPVRFREPDLVAADAPDGLEASGKLLDGTGRRRNRTGVGTECEEDSG